MSFVKRAKKLVVYIVGGAAMLASAGLLDDQTEAIVLGIVSVLTGAGIYQAKNEPAPAAQGGTPHV